MTTVTVTSHPHLHKALCTVAVEAGATPPQAVVLAMTEAQLTEAEAALAVLAEAERTTFAAGEEAKRMEPCEASLQLADQALEEYFMQLELR